MLQPCGTCSNHYILQQWFSSLLVSRKAIQSLTNSAPPPLPQKMSHLVEYLELEYVQTRNLRLLQQPLLSQRSYETIFLAVTTMWLKVGEP